jgi:hypothetical protein
MKRLLPYLEMDNVDDLWAHHTHVMTEFGFDRLFYAFNAFRGAGLYDNPEDALLLTNMPSDYVEAYVGGGMFRDGVMLRWAVQNTGAASWRDVYGNMLQEPLTEGPGGDAGAQQAPRAGCGLHDQFSHGDQERQCRDRSGGKARHDPGRRRRRSGPSMARSSRSSTTWRICASCSFPPPVRGAS